VRLRKARERDVPALVALINGYAQRGLLLARSEDSLRARLADFSVAEAAGELLGCGALSELGPGLGEVRSLAVREDRTGRGIGRRIVQRLIEEAGERGFTEVLALTRSVPFFESLGFAVTRLNLCCDEVAMVREPAAHRAHGSGGVAEAAVLSDWSGA
jgi:amino-acid N-acetyltransferase